MQGRTYVIYGMLLMAVLVFLNLPVPVSLRLKAGVQDNLDPFQRLISIVESKARGLAWYVAGAWHADGTRSDLLSENMELQRELWQLKREVAEDHDFLKEMLGMVQEDKRRLIMCEVMTRGSASGWWQIVRLDRGFADGVETNLAVITSRGLVGRTVEVSRRSSEVLLITDTTSRVACKLRRSGAFGILQGSGVSVSGKHALDVLYSVEPARMRFIRADSEHSEGEQVYTSGLGGIYPAGIPVGRIKSMALDDSRLYLSADVVPSADLRGLRFVFVVAPPEPVKEEEAQ